MFTLLLNSVFRFEAIKTMEPHYRQSKEKYFYMDAGPLIYKGCCTRREIGSSDLTWLRSNSPKLSSYFSKCSTSDLTILGSIPNGSTFFRRVTVTLHLSANTIVVSTPSVDSFKPFIRLRCTRQAIALVRATAGLARMTWSEGDKVGANVIMNRAMLTPVVILFRCPLLSGILGNNTKDPYR